MTTRLPERVEHAPARSHRPLAETTCAAQAGEPILDPKGPGRAVVTIGQEQPKPAAAPVPEQSVPGPVDPARASEFSSARNVTTADAPGLHQEDSRAFTGQIARSERLRPHHLDARDQIPTSAAVHAQIGPTTHRSLPRAGTADLAGRAIDQTDTTSREITLNSSSPHLTYRVLS